MDLFYTVLTQMISSLVTSPRPCGVCADSTDGRRAMLAPAPARRATGDATRPPAASTGQGSK
eukprot:COSAG02_NODE_4501_length_5288_cov_7.650029_5_plen_62_part_00